MDRIKVCDFGRTPKIEIRTPQQLEWMKRNFFDNDWLTSEMAEDINSRMDKGFRPIFMVETNVYNPNIYTLVRKNVTKLNKTKGTDILLKSSSFIDDASGTSQLIIYVGGADSSEYLRNFSSKSSSEFVYCADNSHNLMRVFLINENLELWNVRNVDVRQVTRLAGFATKRAPIEQIKQKEANNVQILNDSEILVHHYTDKYSRNERKLYNHSLESESELAENAQESSAQQKF